MSAAVGIGTTLAAKLVPVTRLPNEGRRGFAGGMLA